MSARRTMGKILWTLAFTVLIVSSAAAADLELTIANVRSDSGALLIGLYDNPKGFLLSVEDSAKPRPTTDPLRLVGVAMRATSGTQSIVFRQLPPGRYAIIVIHDENDNGLLDENALGVPTEGYGFSNNALGFLSAPSFEAAAVIIESTDKSVSISLIYPRMESSQDLRDLEELLGH